MAIDRQVGVVGACRRRRAEAFVEPLDVEGARRPPVAVGWQMANVPQTYADAFAWLTEQGHEFDEGALRIEEYQDGVADAYDIWLPVKEAHTR